MKIGLEVHVQLLTSSKLFCGCPNKFVREPNTYVDETCLGFPGSKPRVNAKAVEYAIRIGLALNCKFPPETFFSRKSYFYPDMSKNFQITQYEIPFAYEGHLQLGDKKIRIRRIQLEEDPARLVHSGGLESAKYVLVDYNRSGTPLCEIVTEPDFSSPEEARDFMRLLSSMLEYLGVYDSSIEGSMRADANVSIAETRVEVKNVTGFADVEKALKYEIVRQKSVISQGKKVERETRGWDAIAGVTRSMRTKEQEEDYGYIFDTDLPLITLERKKIKEIEATLPEFASQKVARYKRQFDVEKEIALAITSEPSLAEAFEKVIVHVSPQIAAPFFSKVLLKTLNYGNFKLKDTKLTPEHLTKLLKALERKEVTERAAELLLRDLVASPKPPDPEELLRMKGMERIYDESQLKPMMEQVLAANARAVLDFRTGRKESFEFLVGQVMRATHGRADPSVIRQMLQKRLEK